uniref:Uncharacterized protein n=1 Tax=Cacopsylla melanoneura TaxID=428564 RepID=A0A8D8M9N4_9HEMI
MCLCSLPDLVCCHRMVGASLSMKLLTGTVVQKPCVSCYFKSKRILNVSTPEWFTPKPTVMATRNRASLILLDNYSSVFWRISMKNVKWIPRNLRGLKLTEQEPRLETPKKFKPWRTFSVPVVIPLF